MPQATPGTSSGQQLELPPLGSPAGSSATATQVLLAGPFQGAPDPSGNIIQYDHAAFGAGQAEAQRTARAAVRPSPKPGARPGPVRWQAAAAAMEFPP
eukprot:305756-Pyramimonas_sp.AAC.1